MSKRDEVLPPWAEIQKKTFTNWVNVHLAARSLKIENLANDFSDGLKLINLLEQISAKRLPKYNKAVKFHNQKLENVGVALKFLKDEGLKLVAIGPEDVVECRIKLILGLIWTIILRWQIQNISAIEGGAHEGEKGGDSKAELIAWVNSVIPKNPVKNLNKDWQDGKSLAALTNYLRPGSVQVTPEDEAAPLQLVTKAVNAAEAVKVPAVISPEDIISPHLDDLSMMTYVSMFRERDAQLKRPDATKFTVHGSGLKNPVARKKNKFTVVSRNADGVKLRSGGLLIKGKYAPKPAESDLKATVVKDLRNGEYTVSYIPTSPGEYVIYISLQETEIAGSPFLVSVGEPTTISHLHSSVDPDIQEYEGEEVDLTLDRRFFYFRVITKQHDGSPVTHGGAPLVAIIASTDGQEIETFVDDRNDGTYYIIFAQPPFGEYNVAIGLADDDGESVLNHVKGSPFSFVLSPEGVKTASAAPPTPKKVRISPKHSVVETTLRIKPDGQKFFHVVTKDDEGKQVYSPSVYANLRAKLKPVDSAKGPYFLISRLNDLVLATPENKNVAGEYVLTWTRKTGDPNQLWKITGEGDIENAKTGLILDIAEDGFKVVLKKKGRDGQKWEYNAATELFASKKPSKSGKENLVLDIQHAKKNAGASIVLFAKRHFNSNKSQRWYLSALNKSVQAAPPPTVSTFYIASRLHGLVLSVKGDPKQSGAEVVLAEKKPTSGDAHTYQLWKFTPDGFVQNAATGLVLDVTEESNDGVRIVVWKKKPQDTTTQKWKYSPTTELLESDKHGLVLDIHGANKLPGANAVVHRQKGNNTPHQKWYLIPSAAGNVAAVPGASSAIPVEIQDHNDGTYDLVFVPEVAGKYDVTVGLADEETTDLGGGVSEEQEEQTLHLFKNAPFQFELKPSEDISPLYSTISPRPRVLPNGDRVFAIHLKGKDKEPLPYSGVPVVAHLVPKKLLRQSVGSLKSGEEKPAQISIVDLGHGAYDLIAKVPTSGTYTVDAAIPDEATLAKALSDPVAFAVSSPTSSPASSSAATAASSSASPALVDALLRALPHDAHINGTPFDITIDLSDDLDATNSTVDRKPRSRPASDREDITLAFLAAKKSKHGPPAITLTDDLGRPAPVPGAASDEASPVDEDDDATAYGGAPIGGKKRAKKSKKPEEIPEFVTRVWKARARDNEGKPLLHGGAPIVAKAKDKNGDALPVAVEDNKDGTYDVVVAVPTPRPFTKDDASEEIPVTLAVGISRDLGAVPAGEETIDVPFSDTPFVASVNFDDNKTQPEAILELIPTPKFTKDTSIPYFVVLSKDKSGKPLNRGGLPVAARLANLAELPADLDEAILARLADVDDKEALILALAATPSVGLDIKDKNDGTYRIFLEEPLSGDFVLDLGLKNDDDNNRRGGADTGIKDRAPDVPIVLSIDVGVSDALGDLDITKSEADLSQFGNDILPDGAVYFPVISKDSNGEPLPVGGAPIGAAVSIASPTGDKNTVPAKVLDNGDGTYQVSFIPEKLPGVYSIAVGLENSEGELLPSEEQYQIKDFPLLVQLGPPIYDPESPLTQAAVSLLVDLDTLGHKPEDGDGNWVGFDVVLNPKKRGPKPSDVGASIVANIVDGDLKPIPVKIREKPELGKARVSFLPPFKGEHTKPLLAGVGVADGNNNVVEVPDSPFELAVTPDGAVVPLSAAPGTGEGKRGGDGDKGKGKGKGADDDGLSSAAVRRAKGPSDKERLDDVSTPFELKSSPFKEVPQRPQYAKPVEAPSAQHTTVEFGKAFPRQPATFLIHPKNAHGHPVPSVTPALFRTKIVDPQGSTLKPKSAANPDGTIGVTYTPTIPGPHKVHVDAADPSGKFHPVARSPFDVKVMSSVSAPHSKLTGPQISDFDTSVTNRQPSFFIISTYGPDGDRVHKGGEKFEVHIKPPSILSSVLALFVKPEITDNNDGTYTVRYEPRDAGKHSITVTLHGENVGASPVEIEVDEGTDEGESIAVDFMFSVEARTKNGAPRGKGGDKFEVFINAADGTPVPDVKLEDLSATNPGKYRVFYTLPGKGKYTIRALLNGKDIKGSPWKQKL